MTTPDHPGVVTCLAPGTRVEVLGTAAHHYAGRLALDFVFDEFSFDAPLNRTILAATRTVAESAALRTSLRLRAIRARGATAP